MYGPRLAGYLCLGLWLAALSGCDSSDDAGETSADGATADLGSGSVDATSAVDAASPADAATPPADAAPDAQPPPVDAAPPVDSALPADAAVPVDVAGDAPLCAPGRRTCPCDADGACEEGLVCDRGFCVDADPCEPGTQDCPCDEGQCRADLECREGACVPAACAPGTAGCPCAAGDTCEGPLVCEDGRCRAEALPDGVRVEGPPAWGCDVLFYEQGDARVRTVRFNGAVIGEHLRRDGKLAMAFVGRDGPVARIGAIVLEGERAATPEDLELRSSTCFDENGRAVEDARVVLE